jgi:ribosomal protein S27E
MREEVDKAGFMEEVMSSEVVGVRCNNCGRETIMNRKYAKYVVDGIGSCRECRGSKGLVEV